MITYATIENVPPKTFRPIFRENRLNYVKMERLLEIARKIAA